MREREREKEQLVDRRMNHFMFWQKMEPNSDNSGDFHNHMGAFQGTKKRCGRAQHLVTTGSSYDF